MVAIVFIRIFALGNQISRNKDSKQNDHLTNIAFELCDEVSEANKFFL